MPSSQGGNPITTPGLILLSRYQIVRLLGEGGQKIVYLARDGRLGDRLCVVAEMIDRFGNDHQKRLDAVQAFKREAAILATLSNQHIPTIFDSVSDANHHYLIMEYVEGETLELKLEQSHQLSCKEVIAIGLQVADTLNYLHSRQPPVIYRDLKPSNLIINPAGQVRLVDFGIARHFLSKSTATMVGTQGYAAPEQYKGKADPRSDLYALAATLHHALTGRDPTQDLPFSFPPLRDLCPTAPIALAELIDSALKNNVEQRIQSAAIFKARLLQANQPNVYAQKAVAPQPKVSAPPPPPPPPIQQTTVKLPPKSPHGSKSIRDFYFALGTIAVIVAFISVATFVSNLPPGTSTGSPATPAAETTTSPAAEATTETSPGPDVSVHRFSAASDDPHAAFEQGLTDRQSYETWVSSLSDGSQFKTGALYWTSVRSTKKAAVGCHGPGYTGTDDQNNWASGCEAAKAKLAPSDYRRRTNPNYRNGWNSVYAAPASTAATPNTDGSTNQPPAPMTKAEADAVERNPDSDVSRDLVAKHNYWTTPDGHYYSRDSSGQWVREPWDHDSPTASTNAESSPAPAPTQKTAQLPPTSFTIGSSKQTVLAVQGTPTSIMGNMWFYGYCYVTFDANDSVSGYLNNCGNLHVKLVTP
jgi:serine/threonine protein kinase